VLYAKLQVPHQPSAPGVVGPFSLADTSVLKDSLSKAGFRNIHIETQNVTFQFSLHHLFVFFI
jgi:hypothetical protein